MGTNENKALRNVFIKRSKPLLHHESKRKGEANSAAFKVFDKMLKSKFFFLYLLFVFDGLNLIPYGALSYCLSVHHSEGKEWLVTV